MPVAHLFLMLLLGSWAFLSLRDKPLRHYAAIYFLAGLTGFLAEFTASGVLGLYDLRVHMLADSFHDVRLAAIFDKLGNLPLIAVLFARYSHPHPVVRAVGAASALGLLELFMLETGAMEYHAWNTLWTVLLFSGYFILVSRAAAGRIRIPNWMHVDAFAFWAAFLVDVLFHGAYWLWHYDVSILGDSQGDSRIVAFLLCAFLIAPLATCVSLVPKLRGIGGVFAGTLLLMAVEAWGVWSGWIEYDGWHLGLAALRYLLALGLPVLYAGWLTRLGGPAVPHGPQVKQNQPQGQQPH